MINNRQNGRRRGRGGTRPPNGSNPGPERGNRLDSRARGNANQLHEKYKTLARDAQMQGDRVMTEYYLQFADHYFRVLSETRSRFEEQRRFRDDNSPDFDEDEGDGDTGGFDERGDYRADEGQEYRQQPQRQNDGDRQNDSRRNEGRQNEGRQNEGRQSEGRQNEGRQNDRQAEGRQNDGRQNEGRSGEGRQEGRRERGNDRPRRDRQPDNRPAQGQAGQGESRPVDRRPQDEGQDRQGNEPQSEIRPSDMLPFAEPLTADQAPAIAQAPIPQDETAMAERPRRTRVRREVPAAEAAPERIEIDRLPPSFAAPSEPEAAVEPAGDGEEAPRRRRTRRPRTDAAPVEA